MKKSTVIFTTIALSYIGNASAALSNPIREDILARAQETRSGVIVGVSDRGDMAADTAWLLSAQIKRDNSYAPLLLVLNPKERERTLHTLKLSENALPALIYYDRNGREISRVIGAMPSHLIKQVGSNGGNDTVN